MPTVPPFYTKRLCFRSKGLVKLLFVVKSYLFNGRPLVTQVKVITKMLVKKSETLTSELRILC